MMYRGLPNVSQLVGLEVGGKMLSEFAVTVTWSPAYIRSAIEDVAPRITCHNTRAKKAANEDPYVTSRKRGRKPLATLKSHEVAKVK